MQFQVVSAAEASQVGGRPSVPPVILWLPLGGGGRRKKYAKGIFHCVIDLTRRQMDVHWLKTKKSAPENLES